MKTIKFLGLLLLIALVFYGCSKNDDDNSENMQANAKGIELDNINGEIDVYLWINNDVVKVVSDEEYLNLNGKYLDAYAYHPFTKETLYQIVCENYRLTMEDLVKYKSLYKEDWPEIRMGERNLSKYKYIVGYGNDIILFNRTSSVNY